MHTHYISFGALKRDIPEVVVEVLNIAKKMVRLPLSFTDLENSAFRPGVNARKKFIPKKTKFVQ